jgi:DNA modification methylase
MKHETKHGTAHLGDTLRVMATLLPESIDCVITSPPYWQLRDYGFKDQWGLEPTYQEYLEKLWLFMGQVKRVLKKTGTVWVNLGDTYGGSWGYHTDWQKEENSIQNRYSKAKRKQSSSGSKFKSKCLALIPHRFAIGCIDRGWILRNNIIWGKINGMPESCTDRFSKRHEHVFFFVKSQKYYFDLDSVRDNHLMAGIDKRAQVKGGVKHKSGKYIDAGFRPGVSYNENGKNPGDVSDFWALKTMPSSDEHYASFGTDLIDKPIMAGCPKGGVILDPFCGSGTTVQRAIQLGRKAIGIDAKREHYDMTVEKLETEREKRSLFDELRN